MSTRLFVAVAVDRSVIESAEQTAGEVRRRLGARVKARWVGAANMHLTVRFIGNVDDGRVPAVLDALKPPLAIAPFEIRLETCGTYPPSGSPRVIWIGVPSALAPLSAMHHEFNRRLVPLGFEPERRPFSAHLTLARIADADRETSKHIRDAVRAVTPSPARCRVSAATVFRSRLSPAGATYHPLLDVFCAG
jgi:RNA 2',3'-cyclic 3'-phosphodiesterase